MLSDWNLVTDNDCANYLTNRGKGWVFVLNGSIVGFAIVDLFEKNVWALFVHPDYEKQGIGRKLHDQLLQSYFTQTSESLWLSTAKGTRAEKFYKTAGWHEDGLTKTGEILFRFHYKDFVPTRI